MQTKFLLCLALATFSVVGNAASVYVDSASIDGSSAYFGSIDLKTGAFAQIGPNAPPEGLFGLVGEKNGTLLALTYAGNLERFNPGTGTTALVGPTGLGSCVVPSPACTANSSSTIGALGGAVYGTDFANNLYQVSSGSGHAALIGSTGIPAIPYVPGTQNANGSVNLYDQAMFSSGGKLYSTFDAFVIDFSTNTPVSIPVDPALYAIDPSTGRATKVGSTDLGIGAVTDVDGVLYAFNDLNDGIYTLNAATGQTEATGVYFDPAAGVVQGAVATPEPGSLAGLGILFLLLASAGRRSMRARRTGDLH